jgi:hypothetical protein
LQLKPTLGSEGVFEKGEFMYRVILAIMIMSMLLWTGCSDDDSGLGPEIPAGGNCTNVAGNWSMALETEGGWFGGVLSSVAELVQSDTCTVTGTMVLGPLIEGYVTNDSLYFWYGETGAAPEDKVYCALAIIDEYFMEGEYTSIEESGVITLHGPNPDCSGTVELQVSAGLSPVFSWQPGCSVSFMLIEPLGSGADQWMVGNENANDLVSGVSYGVAPIGINSRDTVPLEVGTPYEVVLYRWSRTDDAYLMVGYALFTP